MGLPMGPMGWVVDFWNGYPRPIGWVGAPYPAPYPWVIGYGEPMGYRVGEPIGYGV